jgi:N-acetylglutamate synthase-like GNAT family acetyltransferase
LGTIFVDPDIQDRGIGTQAWKFIEATYPDMQSWKLGTPDWTAKNHYFYEQKCGFEKGREDPVADREGVSFIYWKRMDDVRN